MRAAMASLRMVTKLQAGFLGYTQRFHSALKTTSPILQKIQQRNPQVGLHPAFLCSTLAPLNGVSVQYKHGRPVMEVPLPSRKETCLFFLRPMLMSVGDLITDLQREDPGVTASVLDKNGERIANATLIDTLLDQDFQLLINDAAYEVQPPKKEFVSSEHVMELGDMKHMVHLLHTALHLSDHHQLQERQLLERLHGLQQELSPLEEVRAQLSRRAEFHSSRALWAGMALLSVQGGALAWLTWWVYSWDVMEPVTYFITYATSIGVFSYFVLTKQDYVYPDAKDRQFLHYFYKGAKRNGFNIQKYNQLKEQLTLVEEDLRRLRNPNQLQLPVEQIQAKP